MGADGGGAGTSPRVTVRTPEHADVALAAGASLAPTAVPTATRTAPVPSTTASHEWTPATAALMTTAATALERDTTSAPARRSPRDGLHVTQEETDDSQGK